MKKRTIPIAAILMAIPFLIVSGCRGDSVDSDHDAVEQRAPLKVADIVVKQVHAGEIDGTREFAGSVRSRTVSHISARIMAQVIDVLVEEGGSVKKGDLVIRLSDTELRAKVRQAKGALKRAEAGLELAELTLGRYKSLLEQKAVSQQEYDTVVSKEKMARESVAQAKSAVEEAVTFLGFTEIRSPVTGRVVSRRIDPGSMANPGMPLLSVEPEGAYRIELPVDVSISSLLDVGSRIRVIVEAAGMDEEVTISDIVPMVDPASRTFTAKALLPGNERLRSGQYAKAVVKVGRRSATLVPESAIVHRGQLDGVFVLMPEHGYLKYRIIKLGRPVIPGFVEVISGLDAGETIVVKGTHLASDGLRLDVSSGEGG